MPKNHCQIYYILSYNECHLLIRSPDIMPNNESAIGWQKVAGRHTQIIIISEEEHTIG